MGVDKNSQVWERKEKERPHQFLRVNRVKRKAVKEESSQREKDTENLSKERISIGMKLWVFIM